jgi:PII-like signaling protein
MSLRGEHVLLRVYLRNADRAPFERTCDRLVKASRRAGLAGATVFEGLLGFGRRGLARRSFWSIARGLPLVLEIVDTADKVLAFVNRDLPRHMLGGMATLERASVMLYRHRSTATATPLELGPPVEPLSTLPRIQPRHDMSIEQDGVLLRIFIGESDRFGGKPLFEAIVETARGLGLRGATVLRGIEGFGANSVVHRAALLEYSTDLPIVIEIVDSAQTIHRLLPRLQEMVQEGMITMEYVVILTYRHNPADVPSAPADTPTP